MTNEEIDEEELVPAETFLKENGWLNGNVRRTPDSIALFFYGNFTVLIDALPGMTPERIQWHYDEYDRLVHDVRCHMAGQRRL